MDCGDKNLARLMCFYPQAGRKVMERSHDQILGFREVSRVNVSFKWQMRTVQQIAR